jgi:ATP-dependent DNA helicase RecQ
MEHPTVDFSPFNQRKARDDIRLRKMIAYTDGATCRRVHLLRYFGQTFSPPCQNCDVCVPRQTRPSTGVQATETMHATDESDRVARMILQAVADFGGRLGRGIISDVLLGSQRKQIIEWRLDRAKAYGQLRLYRRERILAWIDELIGQHLLRATAEEYPRLRITEGGRQALTADTLLVLAGLAARPSTTVTTSASSDRDSKGVVEEGSQVDPALLERLRRWRYRKAQTLGVPAFWVLHNRVLEAIARRTPRTLGELEVVRGIGARKVEQFGEEIIDVVQRASSG